MKKWSTISATALVAIWLVVDTVREFFANDTVQYFSSEPHRLLYVAVIAIAGGVVAVVFNRLPRPAQCQLKLFAWGAAATTLTAFISYMVFSLVPLSTLIIESADSAWVVLVPLLLSVTAAFLWFEFYRAWNTRKRG